MKLYTQLLRSSINLLDPSISHQDNGAKLMMSLTPSTPRLLAIQRDYEEHLSDIINRALSSLFTYIPMASQDASIVAALKAYHDDISNKYEQVELGEVMVWLNKLLGESVEGLEPHT